MKYILLAALLSTGQAAECLGSIETPLAPTTVYAWTDPETAVQYLVFQREWNSSNGVSLSLVVIPRLAGVPQPPPEPPKPDRDDTYDYTTAPTGWTPINGWERVSALNNTQSRYRRVLGWNKAHAEKAP